MNPNDSVIFQQAVGQAQAGQKAQAYQNFKSLQRFYPQDVKLLLWVAFTTPTLEEARQAIGLATNLEPGNPQVQQAREWLTQELSRPSQGAAYDGSTALSRSEPGPDSGLSIPTPDFRPVGLQAYQPPVAVAPVYSVEVKRLSDRRFPKWLIPVAGLALAVGIALFLLFQLTGEGNYVTYATAENMYQDGGVGQQARFYGKLEANQQLQGFGYAYFNWLSGPRTRLVVRFPRDTKLSPAIGNATYYVKIVDRQPDFLVADIQSIRQ